MEKKTKENLIRESTWLRLIFMIIFVLCFYVAEIIVGFTAVIQFLFKLFTGDVLAELRRLGVSLSVYLRDITAFLTYASDHKPFPFSPWPGGGAKGKSVKKKK